MQNFKMSASEYLRCAPKYTISRLNNQNFSGEPRPTPSAPSALVPPLKNPGYAPVQAYPIGSGPPFPGSAIPTVRLTLTLSLTLSLTPKPGLADPGNGGPDKGYV